MLAAGAIAGACLLLATTLNAPFFALAWAYVLLVGTYSTGLRNVVLGDVGAIAAGFLVRTAAGAAVLGRACSPWFFIWTALVSLLLALGKRRYELRRPGGEAEWHRPVLRKYNEPLLDQLISITTAACLVSYLLYCTTAPEVAGHPGLLLTAPMLVYGLFRYLYFVYRKGRGGQPEDLVRDKVFLAVGLVFAASVLLARSCT